MFPASFDTAAAAGVWDQPEEGADHTLGVLLSRSMVLYDPMQQRWRLHDLMRDLASGHAAAAVLGGPADLAARLAVARRRHAQHYLGVLEAAQDLHLKGGAKVVWGLALFDRERRNIETGQAWAADAGVDDPAAARLCASYSLRGADVLDLRLHAGQRIGWLERAVTAAQQIGDRQREGAALGNLGNAYKNLGETRQAIEHYEHALSIMREIGNRRGEGQTLSNLGLVQAALVTPAVPSSSSSRRSRSCGRSATGAAKDPR